MRFRASVLLLGALLIACSRAATPSQDAGLLVEMPGDDAEMVRAMVGDRALLSTADLDEIKKRGVLRVITRNDSTSYFLYRGMEAGFQYELATLFAGELGVRLELVVPKATRDMIPWLLEGRGDLVMTSLGPDSPRASRVAWTRRYLTTDLVVVVRSATAARSLEELVGAHVVVHPSEAAYKRVRDHLKEQQVQLNLVGTRESLEPEDLIDLVANGEADAAVVTGRVARAALLYRDDLHIAFTLPGEPVEASVAVRKNNPLLFAESDAFVARNYRGTLFNILYRRYFDRSTQSEGARDPELRAELGGALTPWDDEMRRAALDAGLDWRLLAAVAMQESNLNPKARSPMGALGLMQLIPSTARSVGVDDPLDPVQSIHGGARYLAQQMSAFDEPKVQLADQVRFALAAYNAGPGHLIDARKLARTEQLDGNSWFDNVERAMLLLEKPRYYQNARAGYVRGRETVRYVAEIQSRFDTYVKLTTPLAHPALDP